jgi:hypothetical protein
MKITEVDSKAAHVFTLVAMGICSAFTTAFYIHRPDNWMLATAAFWTVAFTINLIKLIHSYRKNVKKTEQGATANP